MPGVDCSVGWVLCTQMKEQLVLPRVVFLPLYLAYEMAVCVMLAVALANTWHSIHTLPHSPRALFFTPTGQVKVLPFYCIFLLPRKLWSWSILVFYFVNNTACLKWIPNFAIKEIRLSAVDNHLKMRLYWHCRHISGSMSQSASSGRCKSSYMYARMKDGTNSMFIFLIVKKLECHKNMYRNRELTLTDWTACDWLPCADCELAVISVSGYTVTNCAVSCAAVLYRDDYTRSSPYQDI